MALQQRLLRLPPHGHFDARAAARVVEEDPLLERPGVELPVLAELESYLGETLGLPRRIETEEVRFRFIRANEAVDEGCGEEEVDREHRGEKRKAGLVLNAADSPSLPKTPLRRSIAPSQKRESQKEEDAEEQQSLVDVVQHVVPHLVAHHRADLLGGAAREKVVVQGDPHRTQNPAHVGADALRLSRRVELIDFVGGNAVGAGHRQNRVLELGNRERAIVVEQGHDEDGRDQRSQGEGGQRDDGAPDPPGLWCATEYRVEKDEQEAQDDERDRERGDSFLEPGAERLIGEAVSVLAEEARINQQRKRKDRGRQDIERGVDGGAERADAPSVGDARREIADPTGQSRREEDECDPEPVEKVQELKPVPALEIGVRPRAFLGRQTTQVVTGLLFGGSERRALGGDRRGGEKNHEDRRLHETPHAKHWPPSGLERVARWRFRASTDSMGPTRNGGLMRSLSLAFAASDEMMIGGLDFVAVSGSTND